MIKEKNSVDELADTLWQLAGITCKKSISLLLKEEFITKITPEQYKILFQEREDIKDRILKNCSELKTEAKKEAAEILIHSFSDPLSKAIGIVCASRELLADGAENCELDIIKSSLRYIEYLRHNIDTYRTIFDIELPEGIVANLNNLNIKSEKFFKELGSFNFPQLLTILEKIIIPEIEKLLLSAAESLDFNHNQVKDIRKEVKNNMFSLIGIEYIPPLDKEKWKEVSKNNPIKWSNKQQHGRTP